MGARPEQLILGQLLSDDEFVRWLNTMPDLRDPETGTFGVLGFHADQLAADVTAALDFRRTTTLVVMYDGEFVLAVPFSYTPHPQKRHSEANSRTTVRDLFDLVSLHAGEQDWSFSVEDAELSVPVDVEEFVVASA